MVRTRQPWSVAKVKHFWRSRRWKKVLSFDDEQRAYKSQHNSYERAFRMQHKYSKFLREYYANVNLESSPSGWNAQRAHDIEYWCVNSSWTFCADCKTLQRVKMKNTFVHNIPSVKPSACHCKDGQYVAPRYHLIPFALRNLSYKELCTLRPLDLHQGQYQVQQHGYRRKTRLTTASYSVVPVIDKINAVTDEESRLRCLSAYYYLMSSDLSSYKRFVLKREEDLRNNREFNVYDYRVNSGVECALWPPLYPFTSWCDTVICKQSTHRSIARSFILKCQSEIVEYGTSYDLLQFFYDLWLFKTVSGAVTTGMLLRCTPARSLENKLFSSQYWKWHFLTLVDSVRQYGYPDVFLTISPFEWSFPVPHFLQQSRALYGYCPTEQPVLESLHIAHVLEQLVRGVITGGNSERWRNQILRPLTGRSCVKNYFYRLEFQNRGTCHVHLLLWLDLENTDVSDFRGDIPWEDTDTAFLVTDLQVSNENALPLREGDTVVTTEGEHSLLKIGHPLDAFTLNVRGYMASVLQSLQCRMDVQTTDHRSMLLKYVTSYVAKAKDSQLRDLSFSNTVLPYAYAYMHLQMICPCAPEMALQLSSLKLAWCMLSTKNVTPCRFQNFDSDKVVQQYVTRPPAQSQLTLLDYCRNYVLGKPGHVRHKVPALVAVRYNSVYHKEFFFQDLLFHHPFRSIEDLTHPSADRYPQHVRFFASSLFHTPERWTDHAVKSRLQMECNKDIFIENVLFFVENRKEIVNSVDLGLLPQNFMGDPPNSNTNLHLQQEQLALFQRTKQMLEQRHAFYSSVQCLSSSSAGSMWSKFLLIHGKPGTGKSFFLRYLTKWAVEQGVNVTLAFPTGILVATFRQLFPDNVTIDTVHSLFQVPVDSNLPMSLNEHLSESSLLIVDEVSMIPLRIIRHMVSSIQALHVRPVVLLIGDKSQQQPFDTSSESSAVPNVYQWTEFTSQSLNMNLYTQHRIGDSSMSTLVDHIRVMRPTYSILRRLTQDRIICESHLEMDKVIHFYHANPDVVFICVSRKASALLNHSIVSSLFFEQQPLVNTLCDTDPREVLSLFSNMEIMITRNLDKTKGVVNGQRGRLEYLRGNNLQILLASEQRVYVHPVTEYDDLGRKVTFYPIVPCYSMTICKAQGQTLKKVAIYFDVPCVPPGSAYVAITRVKRLADLFFLVPPQLVHFSPVVS